MPQATSGRFFSVTWSNLMIVLSPLFESLQLSAVVLYFFWRPNDDGRFGQDSVSTTVLAWGDYGGKRYNNSVVIAAVAVLFYGVLVSLPLAVGVTRNKHEKMIAIRNAPLYEFFGVIISRMFTVILIQSSKVS